MNSFVLTILTVFGLFYQVLSLNEFSLFSYTPNLLIPILIFSHFYLNINYHTILFFLVGLAIDSTNPLLFGSFTLSFMIISYLITLIRDHIDLHIFANKLTLILISNVIFYIIQLSFSALTFKQHYTSLLISLLVGTVINTIGSILVVGLLDFIRMLKFDYSDE